MTFHFSVEYKTQWGEDIRVCVNDSVYPLKTYNGVEWEADIQFTREEIRDNALTYSYALYRDNQLVWKEWAVAPHIVRLNTRKNNPAENDENASYILTDFWRPIPEDLPLYSSAYTECIASHGAVLTEPLPGSCQTLQLRLVEPRLTKNQHLAICGNNPQLGNWEHPVLLSLIGLQEWAVNIDAAQIFRPIEYKYVIVDDNNHILQWEEGHNRIINSLILDNRQTWIKTDSRARFSINNWKCAGIVIPVFSIRTEKSYGIGDFGDLKQMIRWASSVGMHAVQILPINDTTMTGTWQDSYPYNSISIYAFNPIYCDLSALPRLNDKLEMEKFMMQQQELNALPQIDYERVFALKTNYLHLIYEQEGKQTLTSSGFKAYFEANKDWLVPYAAFCFLRDTNHTPDFSIWPKFSKFSKTEISRLCSPRAKNYHQIALHYYIQYLLHLQLKDVHETACQYGVILKGDIPIGISRTSVEAWSEPQYFNLNSQAGAPPDAFSQNGQNWGFPTYNWDVMQSDGYSWWQKRFSKIAEYFDAYRIDHVLGFFRIWDIPVDSVHGLLGQFSPSLPMSQSEIESYGFRFDRQAMTTPYITDDVLYHVFGYRADLVKTLYLDPLPHQLANLSSNAFGGTNTIYKLKSGYDTQRKVQQAFAAKNTPDDINMRDGLYALISNVLFIVDRHNPQMYHPRISAQNDLFYQSMSEQQKTTFNQLYNDYYYRRHNQFWYDEAMKKLPMLTQSTRMLVCAEDLGMVPACVPQLMERLRMLSLEIQSMPKALGVDFGNLSENPYLSVATFSTHDMATMRQWWEEDPERTQQFYNRALQIDGKAPAVLPGWLAEEIVNRHLYCPSMLCLLSFQDWIAISEQLRNPDAHSERINIPANPRHYWRWRMHLTLEQLEAQTEFANQIRQMIQRSGR